MAHDRTAIYALTSFDIIFDLPKTRRAPLEKRKRRDFHYDLDF